MKKILFIILAVISLNSCKKEVKNDSLFKFKEYIYYTTSGRVSVTTPIEIVLAQDITKQPIGSALDPDILSVSPSVKGQYYVKDNRTIQVFPENHLKPDTEYTVTIKLNKLLPNVPSAYKKYQFQFMTIASNFSIQTGQIQSYTRDWQYLEGSLFAADVMPLENVKRLLEAEQKGKKLAIKWMENSGTDFFFTIDSIQRFDEDSEVHISWDGKKIEVANKGEKTIPIIGKNNFSVLGLEVASSPEQYLEINFSDPLKKNQSFEGLVVIEGAQKLRFGVEGNVLRVYPSPRIIGQVKLEVFPGLRSQDGIKMSKKYTDDISFAQLKPAVRLLNHGVLLPDSQNLTFNFEAVNLKFVTVRIVKIFENNVLQFLQDDNLSSSNSYNIRKVGRLAAKKRIELVPNEKTYTGKWTGYALDLAKIIKTEPGAIYRIELSFDKNDAIYNCQEQGNTNVTDDETYEEEYYEDAYYEEDFDDYSSENNQDTDQEEREEMYWDNLIYSYKRYTYNWKERENPCHAAYYNEDRIVTANVLASNIGLIAKKGQNQNYYFTVTDMLTTKPITGASVSLYNYQQQELAKVKTNGEGFAEIKLEGNAYFAIASFEGQKSYIKLNDGQALSLSKFDVSGKQTPKGLKGYLYGERGVWRPGDTLHLTFVLNDLQNPIPNGHPISFELRDTRGQLVDKQMSKKENNTFHKFTVVTNPDAPTGNWSATVKVGGAKFYETIRIATIKPNRFKMQIDFGDNEVIKTQNGLNGKLAVQWLHGAVAKNMKADIQMKLSASPIAFKNYSKYIFQDPTRKFDTEEITIFEGEINSEGIANISKKFPATQSAPGMLKAQFFTKVFEPGGDFSMDVFSKNVAPYSSFVGLLPPDFDAYGCYTTDKKTSFSILSVDDEGKPIQRKNIQVKVYKIDWRWWWSSSYDNMASYVSSKYHEQIYDQTLATNAQGKGLFSIKIPNEKGGRYLIRIVDPVSGHATGMITYFYRDWWKSPGGVDDQSANMLVFSTDKTKYQVGETAHITFPSGADGRALISIENSSSVISQKWVETQKGETKVELPISADMSPNVFINISLLQPHATTTNDLPIRLYGVIPLTVEDPQTRLEPKISMPNVLKPEEKFTIKVSENKGKAMTYTLAVVDEGLLDITRFNTPNIWDAFNQKQALGVTTWDVFDEVIGAYGGTIDQVFGIGGDEAAMSKKGKKANRFKPVVMFLGPFRLEQGKTATHTLVMPNYVGSVRTMLVAGDPEKNAYGSVDKATPVRKPLMLLASLPRKLSPGEKVTLPVTVFAMEKKVKNVQVKIQPQNGFKVIGNQVTQLAFDKPDEKTIYFELEISADTQVGKIAIEATGNGEKATYEVAIDIENPNPISHKAIDVVLDTNESKEIDFDTFGEVDTNTVQFEFSTLPPMNFNSRLDYLIQYPHGCVEQTTSSVFPQLYLDDLFDLTTLQKQNIQKHIQEGIKSLGMFQNPDGGLGYWRGESIASDWGTSYAGHFMLEAEKKGFALPLTFKNNWLKYQKQAAKTWRPTYRAYNTDLAQSYRLYTLALAGEADIAAMNRLREFAEISNEGRWRLAAAYALAGHRDVAQKLANQSHIEITTNTYDYYTYGSVDRNRAMALETLLLVDDKAYVELAKTIARSLSSDQWMSTQSTAYSLYAMAKMLKKGGGKAIQLSYTLDRKKENVKTTKSMALRKKDIAQGTHKILLNNELQSTVYVRILYSGKLPVGQEQTGSKNLSVSVRYEDDQGQMLDISKLTHGTDFQAKVTVTNTSNNYIDNIALSEFFPSGWELISTDFTGYSNTSSQADFVDLRDSKVFFYFGLGAQKSKTFTVQLNASYLGKYYRFGVQAEAMYDNNYYARTAGGWIEVVK